jgi:O-antigen/teichoic acid export membrane protein
LPKQTREHWLQSQAGGGADMASGNTVKHALRWMIMGKGATQGVNWLATIVVIRLLEPADYGLLAMATVLVAIGHMFRDMGLQSALIQSKDLTLQSTRQVYTLLLALNGALCALFFAVAPLAAAHFGEEALTDIVRVLALQFPLLALQAVPLALLAREMDFKTQALLGAGSGIVNSAITLTLALLDYGVWSLVYGNLGATAMRTIVLASIGRVLYLPTLDYSGFRSMFSFGGFVTLSSLLHYIQNNTSRWLIGTSIGKEALGIYSVSNRLASLPMQKVASILNQVGLAAFSKIQHDMQQVRENFLQMQGILAFFAFPTFWGIASVTEGLVEVALGKKWMATVIPLQLIALSVPLRMLFNLTKPALNGIGNSRLVFTNLLIASVAMPVAYYVALPWGVNGVAASWVVCYTPLFFLLLYRTTSALGVAYGDYIEVIYRPALIAGAMYLLVKASWFLLSGMSTPVLATLLIQVGLGGAFYLGASYLFNKPGFRRSRRLLF